ncbi:MAG TPA: hypothetical protein VIZ90_04935 [Rhizobiaceae bacterium]
MLTVVLLSCPTQALQAHDAPTRWAYPPACCHGDPATGECQRIPARTVHGRSGGWVVVLNPGDHPKVTRQQRYFIPRGDENPSGDGDFHICLHPTEADENCFFVPPDVM